MPVATTAVRTKIGVLVAITGQGPTPPEGGTSLHRSGGNSAPHHCYTPEGRENLITCPAAPHPHTRGSPWWNKM
ncbi:hypothetical protein AVEN_107871-1 [Araneus ventricosus]|uniref:Uncharacterized protein n=1 Tax=Araneus ventricosus TaxID=182803 RepID=A0A4Y2QEI5_ARAVE|nr:hypothetical protein AVEN_107871-1 [Araneus ventricosus]